MVVQQMGCFAEISGLDIDDVHVELPQLVPQGGTQTLDRVLRGRVDGQSWISVQAGNAAHVEDSTYW